MSTQCTFPTPLTIPSPPTPAQACAVPSGASNSTLLDTCCNGHINPVLPYSAPGAKDDCYLYCTTDDAVSVQACLSEYMKEGAFQCFGVKERSVEGGAAGKKGGSWVVRVAAGLGVVVVLGGWM